MVLLIGLWGCAGDDTPVREPPDPPPSTDSEPWTGTGTPEGCAVISAQAAPGALLLEQRLAVALESAGPAWATCTSPDAPDELHLAESTADATTHALVLRGLLPKTRYVCRVHAACGGPPATVSFETPVPVGIPPFVATSSGPGPTGAYTLFNTQDGAFSGRMAWVVVVDPDGRVRWIYGAGEDLVIDLDATSLGPAGLHLGGGWGLFEASQPNRGLFRTMDWSGVVAIERTLPDFGLGFNHHSEPLADGSYVSLTGSVNERGPSAWYGVGVEQWHPDQGLLWTWSSQHLVDQGVLPTPEPWDDPPYHANSVELRTDAWGEAAWISLYGAREIWRIDRATGDRTHTFGATGDFALVDPAGRPLPDSEFSWVQHDPDYTDDGRMLVYDNGQGRPSGSYSRVAEYALDLDAREATLLWSWTEEGWYDPIVGDADYLPGGHVLITKGFSRDWTPWSDDVSAIVELAPPDTVVWRLEWTDQDWITFRSQRIDGCDLFANARYCPAVADRVAALEAARY